MLFLIYFLIGYIAFYCVIWLHEVGHGIMYAKYKCKDNPFKVHVPIHMFFSTPEPIDVEKAQTLNPNQQYNIAIAGIVVNLLFGVPITIFLIFFGIQDNFITFFFFAFALLHLVEAASYTVISNIFLAGDMLSVQTYKPKMRIPLFFVGLMVIGLIIYMLSLCPFSWRIGFTIAIIVITLNMIIARKIFSMLNESKSS